MTSDSYNPYRILLIVDTECSDLDEARTRAGKIMAHLRKLKADLGISGVGVEEVMPPDRDAVVDELEAWYKERYAAQLAQLGENESLLEDLIHMLYTEDAEDVLSQDLHTQLRSILEHHEMLIHAAKRDIDSALR